MGSSEVEGANTRRYAVWWSPTYDPIFFFGATYHNERFSLPFSPFVIPSPRLGTWSPELARNPYGPVPLRETRPCNSRLDGHDRCKITSTSPALRHRRDCPSISNRGNTVRHRLCHACVDIENDLSGDFCREETIRKNEDEKLILNKRRALTFEELPCKKRSRVRRHPQSWVPVGQVYNAQDRKDWEKRLRNW
jgi:hypothetical protein